MNESKITEFDKQTATALKLKEYFNARLATLRAKNDECPMERTEKLRGRISEVKNILNVLDTKPTFKIESDDLG